MAAPTYTRVTPPRAAAWGDGGRGDEPCGSDAAKGSWGRTVTRSASMLCWSARWPALSGRQQRSRHNPELQHGPELARWSPKGCSALDAIRDFVCQWNHREGGPSRAGTVPKGGCGSGDTAVPSMPIHGSNVLRPSRGGAYRASGIRPRRRRLIAIFCSVLRWNQGLCRESQL